MKRRMSNGHLQCLAHKNKPKHLTRASSKKGDLLPLYNFSYGFLMNFSESLQEDKYNDKRPSLSSVYMWGNGYNDYLSLKWTTKQMIFSNSYESNLSVNWFWVSQCEFDPWVQVWLSCPSQTCLTRTVKLSSNPILVVFTNVGHISSLLSGFILKGGHIVTSTAPTDAYIFFVKMCISLDFCTSRFFSQSFSNQSETFGHFCSDH